MLNSIKKKHDKINRYKSTEQVKNNCHILDIVQTIFRKIEFFYISLYSYLGRLLGVHVSMFV